MKYFTDEVTVTFTGGRGGAGIISFGKMEKSGPDGGNGGDGGNIYIEAVNDLTLLGQFATTADIEANGGQMGGKNKKSGKAGQDTMIYLPVGSTLTEVETVHPNGITTSGEVIELLTEHERVLLSEG